MQVAPIKPTLKAPGTKRLKVKYDGLLSSFSFKFHLRRYTEGADKAEVNAWYGAEDTATDTDTDTQTPRATDTPEDKEEDMVKYTAEAKVGRCRLTL